MSDEQEAPTTLERGEVNYETAFDLWGIRNDANGTVILTNREREPAERQLRGVVAREEGEPHHVLVRQRVVRRVEEWREPLEVVPWHTPCDWIGTYNDDGTPTPMWCYSHDHNEGEPVPAEHIRGTTRPDVSTVARVGASDRAEGER